MKQKKFALALHGGAGVIPKTIDKKIIQDHLSGLEDALRCGLDILEANGSSIDAVEATVISLENNIHFNAGKGSVFNHEGMHEMDASIMDGKDLSCGAVSSLSNRKNPIAVARLIMEKSEHVYLGGEGADEFCEELGIEKVPNDYFFSQYRFDQLQKAKKQGKTVLDHSDLSDANEIKKKGTVGAVALDSEGNLAAATSTGGMTNKKFGRIGDSPLIGCGSYANNESCAISCTGDGEEFIRNVVAYDVHSQMSYGKLDLEHAVHQTIHQRLKKDDGGLIAIDRYGTIVLDFNTSGMFRASADSNGLFEVRIWE